MEEHQNERKHPKFPQQHLLDYETYYYQWGVQYKPRTGITVPEGISLIRLCGPQPPLSDNFYYSPQVTPLMTPSVLSTDTLNPMTSTSQLTQSVFSTRSDQYQTKCTPDKKYDSNIDKIHTSDNESQKCGSLRTPDIEISLLSKNKLNLMFKKTITTFSCAGETVQALNKGLQKTDILLSKCFPQADKEKSHFLKPYSPKLNDIALKLYRSFENRSIQTSFRLNNVYVETSRGSQSSKLTTIINGSHLITTNYLQRGQLINQKACIVHKRARNDICHCEQDGLSKSRISPYQLMILEEVFRFSKYLSSKQFYSLSETTNLSKKTLRTWFQNRRAKFHKEKKMQLK